MVTQVTPEIRDDFIELGSTSNWLKENPNTSIHTINLGLYVNFVNNYISPYGRNNKVMPVFYYKGWSE